MDRTSGKIFVGQRNAQQGIESINTLTVDVLLADKATPLPSRIDLEEYSMTLECVYGTGGAAQLALAILANVTRSDNYALRHHQWFKLEIVSRFPWNGWQLSEQDVWDWIDEHHPL